VDLQVLGHGDLLRELREFAPEAVGFGLNYLANVPEVIDLSRRVKQLCPSSLVFVGGHSVSFRLRARARSGRRGDRRGRARIGLTVAINLIVSLQWDAAPFERVRAWATSVPEIVNLTVMTPCPGTEIWHTDAGDLTTLDYRLFDIQHAVTPTRLPLHEFYAQLVKTQSVLNRKHLGLSAVSKTFRIIGRSLLRGQTNFPRMLWKLNQVYNAERQYGEHQRPVRYELPPPDLHAVDRGNRRELYVHGRGG
jgi:hypothetical protein